MLRARWPGRPSPHHARRRCAAAFSSGTLAMLRVLQVTNMWPTRDSPNFGSFVESQVRSLVETGEVECRVVYARSDYRELRRRAIEESKVWKPDLVHAHFGYTAAAIAFDCRLRGLPLVISYCGGDLHGEVGDWRRRAKTLTGVAAGVAAGFVASRL